MEQKRIFPVGAIGRKLNEKSLIDCFHGFAPADDDVRGDHDLNDFTPRLKNRDAAVLVPILVHDDQLHILFTKRTDHLKNHPGQISFPGGRLEEQDHSLLDAALRETEEEVGLPRAYVKIIGQLNRYITRTGFSITPYVGLIKTPFPVAPDVFEVDDIFDVPLDFFLNKANHQKCSRHFEGKKRYFWAMPYQKRFIWGATAGMLKNLSEILWERQGND
mgnify:CR=1 FL=1